MTGRLKQFTIVALWFGLATGLLEAAMVLARKYLLDHLLHQSAHVLWMAPLGNATVYVLLSAAIAVTTGLAERRVRRFPGFGLLVFMLVMLTTYAAVHWLPWVAPRAGFILAAGVAVQVARLAHRHQAAWYRFAARWAIPTVVLVSVLGLGSGVWARWEERRRIARLVDPPPGAPNILLLVLDTVGAPWLSGYGYDRPTSPHLDAFARSAMLFERAYATSSWTLPSHATMFTGRYPHEIEADWWVPMDDRFPTLAEGLASVGYVNAGFPANQAYGAPEFGLARGFHHWETYPLSWQEIPHTFAIGRRLSRSYRVRKLLGYWDVLNRKSAAEVNREVLEWLNHAGDRPFFAFLNYFDTHEPCYPPPPYDSLFGPGLTPLPPGTRIEGRVVIVPNEIYGTLPPLAVEQLRDAYDGCLAYLDDQVGRLIRELERRGILENTIVILTADHGESRGEQRRFGHGGPPYAVVLHVPLVLRYPKRLGAGVRVAEPVSLRDLAATVVDLAGLSTRLQFPGFSLARFDDADVEGPRRSLILASVSPQREGQRTRSVMLNGEQYIQYDDGREELFDVIADPFEVKNRLPEEPAAVRAAALRRVLDSAWGSVRWPGGRPPGGR